MWKKDVEKVFVNSEMAAPPQLVNLDAEDQFQSKVRQAK
jgi:hypothetical protein